MIDDPEAPEMIFYAVTSSGVTQVDIFLDERLLGDLNRLDHATWIALIQFVEDDVYSGA